MNIEQIKQLTLDDFIDRNDDVWGAIKHLSFDEVDDLRGTWEDDDIENGLYEIYSEKAEEIFKKEVIDKLTPIQQKALNCLCFDKDGMWDYFRRWTEE